jgi:signal transduction histidine kinase
LTPDAVVYRYLEIISHRARDAERLCLLLSADADLLAQWLQLLDSAIDLDDMQAQIRDLDQERFVALAQTQMLPMPAVPRRSVEQWLKLLRAACLAEGLANHLTQTGADNAAYAGLASANSVNIRLRALLALSGATLPADPILDELIEFRGINPVLLEDASAELRIFTVVDGIESGRERELAWQLLNISEAAFVDLVNEAQVLANAIAERLDIARNDGVDWMQRIWVRQRILMTTSCFDESSSLEELAYLHQLVSRSLFSQPPLILIQLQGQTILQQLGGGDLVIRTGSRTSLVAASIRASNVRAVDDSADLAVVDRQLLRVMQARSALIVPLVSEGLMAALVLKYDVPANVDSSARIYAEVLTKHVVRLYQSGETSAESRLSLEIEQFRTDEHERLREIVHEANNPLSIVQNYLHILELRLQHEPEAVEQIEMIATELRRAGHLFAKARDIPRNIDTDPLIKGEIQPLDVKGWCVRMVEMHRGHAGAQQIVLRTDLPTQAVVLSCETSKLTQVMTNLLKNAVEACQSGDEIVLGIRRGVFREGQQGIEIYLKDSGPGLPDDVLDNLAGAKVSVKSGDHQGIGLQVAFRLSNEMGGALDVHTQLSRGTTFSLFLPLLDLLG